MTATKVLTGDIAITGAMPPETLVIGYGLLNTEGPEYKRCWQMLDTHEQAHAMQLKNKLIHKRYVIVHGQLRSLLAQTLNKTPEKLTIHKTPHGKPYLVDHPQLAFNLSHSGNVFVIALGWNCQLGVDVESHKQRPNLAALVKKCFALEEARYWQQLPDDQKTAEFYRFWTRKEAFVKATGFGIALGLQHCAINPEQPSTFLRIPAHCGTVANWHLQDIDLPHLGPQTLYSALSVDRTITSVQLGTLPTFNSFG